jgi:hypothetical protein
METMGRWGDGGGWWGRSDSFAGLKVLFWFGWGMEYGGNVMKGDGELGENITFNGLEISGIWVGDCAIDAVGRGMGELT